MVGWFKKKPVVPPITDALYAITVDFADKSAAADA
jgi:hypothetical protein